MNKSKKILIFLKNILTYLGSCLFALLLLDIIFSVNGIPIGGILRMFVIAFPTIIITSFIPYIIFLGLKRKYKIRSLYSYAIAGALASTPALLLTYGMNSAQLINFAKVMLAFVIAGTFSGLFYGIVNKYFFKKD